MTQSERNVLLDRLVEIRTAMLRSHGGKEGLTETERRNVIELVDQLRRRGGYEANVWVNA